MDICEPSVYKFSRWGPHHNGHLQSIGPISWIIMLIHSIIWCLIVISMSLVTKMRWGLHIAGGIRASSWLEQIVTVSQGKCLQSMMQAQVYLYHIFHPQWNELVGREF